MEKPVERPADVLTRFGARLDASAKNLSQVCGWLVTSKQLAVLVLLEKGWLPKQISGTAMPGGEALGKYNAVGNIIIRLRKNFCTAAN
jgi:hypothetical protein